VKRVIGLLALFIYLPTFAQAPAPKNSPVPAEFNIQQIDPHTSIDSMKGPNVHLHSASEINGSLPSVDTRNEIFKKAGLQNDTKSWDELDKDMLYVAAKSAKLDALKKKYPKINSKKLVVLKIFIKATATRSNPKK
jgi:hypothetical protein